MKAGLFHAYFRVSQTFAAYPFAMLSRYGARPLPTTLRLAALLFVLLFGAAETQAVTVAVVPSSERIDHGNDLNVELRVSDLGAGIAPSISVYDFDVGFDATILSFVGAEFSLQLDPFGLGSITSVMEVGIGKLNVFEISLDYPNDLDFSRHRRSR